MQVQVLLVFVSYYITTIYFFHYRKKTLLCVKASVTPTVVVVCMSVSRCDLCLSPPHLSHCCSHPAVLQLSPLRSLSADRNPQQLVLFYVIYFAFIVFISDLDCSNTSLTAKLTFWKKRDTIHHISLEPIQAKCTQLNQYCGAY